MLTHRFSSTTRESSQRAYVSPEHAREQLGRTGSDPGLYMTVPALGNQPLSGKSNQPAFTWAREDRLKQSFEKAASVRQGEMQGKGGQARTEAPGGHQR